MSLVSNLSHRRGLAHKDKSKAKRNTNDCVNIVLSEHVNKSNGTVTDDIAN